MCHSERTQNSVAKLSFNYNFLSFAAISVKTIFGDINDENIILVSIWRDEARDFIGKDGSSTTPNHNIVA